jgi:hypothetical protein
VALRSVMSLAVVLAITSASFADEPIQDKSKNEKPFVAPAPQPTPAETLPSFYVPPLPRPGTREVWQYYGVDSRGRFVPRVMQSPYGNYYLYNGMPYLYGSIERLAYMPYVVD